MPVVTRSSSNKVVQDTHKFTNSIVNTIVDNAVDIINHRRTAVGQDAGASAAGVSASIGLGCCSICLEDIQFEKGRFVLECGHAFHSKCILTSFQHGNRCPNCRTEVKESIAHEQAYMMPSSLRVYTSIIHDAADHFIEDLGNITFANVVHRMLLMSSENQDLRSMQYSYIKRLLVQFASVFIQGVAFSVRDNADGGREIQDPVPIDIVDNMIDSASGDPDYDAALSNPALDVAVAYQAIITTDMNFDSPHPDNVGSALIRRSVALAAMGSQRADLALRRAAALSRRQEQMQEVYSLLQRAQEEALGSATAAIAPTATAAAPTATAAAPTATAIAPTATAATAVALDQTVDTANQNQNINMVISENQTTAISENQIRDDDDDDDDDESNPWGTQF